MVEDRLAEAAGGDTRLAALAQSRTRQTRLGTRQGTPWKLICWRIGMALRAQPDRVPAEWTNVDSE
jgi:hypothetical protein